jgi:hypothetical protein
MKDRFVLCSWNAEVQRAAMKSRVPSFIVTGSSAHTAYGQEQGKIPMRPFSD